MGFRMSVAVYRKRATMDGAQITTLHDCCERWILKWGEFYQEEAEFVCLPYGHQWRKRGRAFMDLERSITYRMRAARGFKYLEPEGVDPPLVNWCCYKILSQHGPQIPVRQLPFHWACPVCNTPWSITEGLARWLLRLRLYRNESLERTFKLEDQVSPPRFDLVSQDTLVT